MSVTIAPGLERDEAAEPRDASEPSDTAERSELERLRTKIANLDLALLTARRIGAAVGIVMAREQVTYEHAFERLCHRSQLTNTKLRDVAEHVLYTGTC